VQAYAGLAQSADESGNKDAARVDGDRFRVVCTPSGGAKTAELELPGDWEDGMDDEALLKEIESARQG
jgi:hypothetical protein